MEPTPPLPDVRAETDVPRSSPRWQGLAAGIVAAVVLAVLAWLALVPWLRNRTPAAEPKVAAAAAPTPTPTRTPTAIPTPVPAQVAIPAAAPTPTPTASSAGTVEVRRGDTLWHLSAVHLGDPLRWPDLHHANRARIANPDLIFPGQVLHVPSR